MLRVDGRSLQLRELIIGEGQDLEEVARVTGVAAPAAEADENVHLRRSRREIDRMRGGPVPHINTAQG